MLLVNVIDGDTVYGYVDTSDPEVAMRVKLRIAGIDTPETGGRAQCDAERAKAAEAKNFLVNQLSGGPCAARAGASPAPARSRATSMAAAVSAGWRSTPIIKWLDLGSLMIKKGLAFPYAGGKRGEAWCTCLDSGQCPEGYQG